MADKLPSPNIWGTWGDEGPYHVLADGITIEEAKKICEDATNCREEGFIAVPSEKRQPRPLKVWDCQYALQKPCKYPDCRHGHIEKVYEFYLEEEEG